jgi:hypothetical protein
MTNWKDIGSGSWNFSNNIVVSNSGGGVGSYETSYALNLASSSFLNGKVSADIKIVKKQFIGTGLVCRADKLWTFLAMYVASYDQTDALSMSIGVWKQGIFEVIVSKKEKIYLDDGFNHFSLVFSSGSIKGEIDTSKKTYVLEYQVPHIPFPGYAGLIKFYGTEVTAKNLKIEHTSYPELISGVTEMTTYQYDVFISHSSQDKLVIERIIQDLRNNGITYWVDHEQIKFGDYVTNKIEDGLRRSKSVLVCLSSNLGRSNWCRAEYGPILNRELSKPSGKRVIPLRLDKCDEDDIPTLLYDIKRADYSNNEEYNALLKFLKT